MLNQFMADTITAPFLTNNMKNSEIKHSVETVPKSKSTILERCQMDTPSI
jgi:hypothetical protein